MYNKVEIRQLSTLQELEQVQQLEGSVWNDQTIPTHQTLTAVKNGGIIIGAFHNQKLIGFSYGFTGFKDGQTYLCSHMLGIDEKYRGQGIGALLKEEQKKAAIEKGYSLLTWTYDPLESVNGFLNLTKLGAICSTYMENCYGEMEDGFNKGLPSDRFQVEWWIKSPYLDKKPEWNINEEIRKIHYEITIDGWPKAVEVNSSQLLNHKALLVPVPKRFQNLKKEHYKLALDWRLYTRQLFQSLFSNGYAAVGVIKTEDEPVVYYRLQKRCTLPLE
jgi:predicted GNAT superfamily acetyltransferase